MKKTDDDVARLRSLLQEVIDDSPVYRIDRQLKEAIEVLLAHTAPAVRNLRMKAETGTYEG